MKRLKNIFAAALYYITVCLLFILEVPIVITTTVFLVITSLLSTIQQKLTKLNKWINTNYHPKRNK
jgi:hypothetical protein